MGCENILLIVYYCCHFWGQVDCTLNKHILTVVLSNVKNVFPIQIPCQGRPSKNNNNKKKTVHLLFQGIEPWPPASQVLAGTSYVGKTCVEYRFGMVCYSERTVSTPAISHVLFYANLKCYIFRLIIRVNVAVLIIFSVKWLRELTIRSLDGSF